MARPEELSGQVWPIHLKPLDDELLSCWMVRLARAYGVKPVWFWNRVWKRDAVAYRFVDRSAPVELLLLLSAGTGTRYERVVQTTLQPLADVRSIPAAVPSLRYCPECLAADPVPYSAGGGKWGSCRRAPFMACACVQLVIVAGNRSLRNCSDSMRRRSGAARIAGPISARILLQLKNASVPRCSIGNGGYGVWCQAAKKLQRPMPPAAFSRKRLPSRM